MNYYEKSGLIRDHIKDLHQLLGAYLSMDGCEKNDKYAEVLIEAIIRCEEELVSLIFETPVAGENDEQNS